MKSGRCCKHAVSVNDTEWVSIPLKSGRCCKLNAWSLSAMSWSQSLWSQGGAARNHLAGKDLRKESQSLWSQGGAASATQHVATAEQRSQSLWSQGGAASTTKPLKECIQAVSIPLKSGRCCKGYICHKSVNKNRLNPFEVREVLQGRWLPVASRWTVSIPLKSGRCCKVTKRRSLKKSLGLNPFEVREVLQALQAACISTLSMSQSLWSQGGAARATKPNTPA